MIQAQAHELSQQLARATSASSRTQMCCKVEPQSGRLIVRAHTGCWHGQLVMLRACLPVG